MLSCKKKRFGQIHTYEQWLQPYLVSNTLQLLQSEIPKLRNRIESVQLCFTTDPFMYEFDEIAKMSKDAIQLLNLNGIKCTVLTKGILPLELGDKKNYSMDNEYGITLISLDEKYREKMEPYAAPYQQRIDASAKYIQRLKEPKNQELMEIINCADEKKKVQQFNAYIRKAENLKKFQKIFPIIATTSISAHKLGEPGTYFDMVIMDEASQGNIAMSLVPIIRGRSLMLVGDPQQLSPVILLHPADNERLKKIYSVTEEYDYIKNSIYKTYLACDAVSEEILLSHHYRCNEKIIAFNNQKYYNNKLVINSQSQADTPLIFKNIAGNTTNYKNTAPREAEEIIEFIKDNPDKSIGVITPFTNQKELIHAMLQENGMKDVPCGTVHAFQGDEKDVVLFSLALTEQTGQGTYDWLKNNKELINVATPRAKEQLVIPFL